jgi:hypothetical protein
MSQRRRPFSWGLLLITVLLAGACGGGEGCGGCGSTTPLPAGGLPVDQTVEGGGQIRVTPTGMNKIQTLARDMVEEQLGEGFCVPPTSLGDPSGFLGTGARLCQGNQRQCTPGCDTDIHIDTITVSAAGSQTLRLRAQVDATLTVPTSFQIVGIPGSCNVGVTANNFVLVADIPLTINNGSGELVINTPVIPRPSLSVDFSGCGLGSVLLDLFSGFFTGFIVDQVIAVVRPTLEGLVRDLIPNPMGIAGTMDLGSLLAGVSSGSEATLEARVLPGGYVRFVGSGLSVGVITAFNADRNPATREADLDSEVARCVPPLLPLDFTAPPRSLPRTIPRNTFALPAAGAFDGNPEPAGKDLSIGLSETTFDLLGHHLVTSGAACLGVGTAQISQLSLGIFGFVSPSLAELGTGNGKDPMLLVTRPTRAVDFTIGEGTEASPRLQLKIENFDVDIYAFLYERYVRAFTMTLSLDVGLNLELEQAEGQPVSIKPVLVGLESKNIRVKVENNELIRETAAELQTKLPLVFDLALPALLGGLPSIALPAFAGFSLQDLAISKVMTAEDSFLAVQGNLGTLALPPAQAARIARARGGMLSTMIAAPPMPARAHGRAELVAVDVPSLAEVRSAADGTGGRMPSVTFAVDRLDAQGRELEWSWRLDAGLWRPYQSGEQLVIADKAFAFQGDYEISLMARVKGDYRTVSAEQRFPVRLDSVGPRLVAGETRWSGGALQVMGVDGVAGRDIEIAFGAPGSDAPATAWTKGQTAELSAAEGKALVQGGEVVVFLRDPSGNVEVELVPANFHGQAGESGCTCATSGGPSGGAIALFLMTLGVLAKRRRRGAGAAARALARVKAAWPRLRGAAKTAGVLSAVALGSSMLPGCSCSSNASNACEVVQDCSASCEDFEVPFCVEGGCICAEDIPPGKIGPYADIAVSGDGVAWVTAYSQQYGDLVAVQAKPGRVAPQDWEWVDGVPAGPVVIENAKIRHGIEEKGDDVGMYPSIAVTKKGEPVISYFDRQTASLRFTIRSGGTWKSHVVDAGTKNLSGPTGAVVGMYTSLTLRADDGRPGIAYLAHVKDDNGVRAEVRYASAQVEDPQAAGDWMIKRVDTAPVPVATPTEPDIYPLPAGLGLFVDSGRLPNQAPVVVYYDRTSGALKMSAFNPTASEFDMPVLLDGGTNDDAGWSPTLAVDGAGAVHVAYVGAAKDDLEYLKVGTSTQPEIVDDGYRVVGETPDGLPKPELHFVGDDASLVVSLNGVPVITYQDATSHELLVARRNSAGVWARTVVAGDEEPFEGAYGFFAASAATSSKLYAVSWVLDPANEEQWVEVFEQSLE